MAQLVLAWFPSVGFANLYGLIALAALLSDQVVPRLTGARRFSSWGRRDRGSFIAIYLCAQVGFAIALLIRFLNVGVAPPWVQLLAVALIIVGTLLRAWAILELGRFFSRVVQIAEDHRLITGGPYRWIRHPAYTGMLIMDSCIVLGLGTWAGALLMLVAVLIPTLYRIRIEEEALLEALGEEYRAYVQRSWRLVPGW